MATLVRSNIAGWQPSRQFVKLFSLHITPASTPLPTRSCSSVKEGQVFSSGNTAPNFHIVPDARGYQKIRTHARSEGTKRCIPG